MFSSFQLLLFSNAFFTASKYPLEDKATKPTMILYSLLSFSLRDTSGPDTYFKTPICHTDILKEQPICPNCIGFRFWTLLTLDFAGSKNYFSLFLGTRVEFIAPDRKIAFVLSRMKSWAAISHPFWKKDCHRLHHEQQRSRHSGGVERFTFYFVYILNVFFWFCFNKRITVFVQLLQWQCR